jgi:hypothetical protein
VPAHCSPGLPEQMGADILMRSTRVDKLRPKRHHELGPCWTGAKGPDAENWRTERELDRRERPGRRERAVRTRVRRGGRQDRLPAQKSCGACTPTSQSRAVRTSTHVRSAAGPPADAEQGRQLETPRARRTSRSRMPRPRFSKDRQMRRGRDGSAVRWGPAASRGRRDRSPDPSPGSARRLAIGFAAGLDGAAILSARCPSQLLHGMPLPAPNRTGGLRLLRFCAIGRWRSHSPTLGRRC